MAYQFNGFRATRPVVRLIDAKSSNYEVFFCLYDNDGSKKNMRYKAGINSLPRSERRPQAIATADVLWEALQNGWDPRKNKYPDFNRIREQKRMTLEEGLEHALKEKIRNLSKFSAYDYKGAVRFILAAAKTTGHRYTMVNTIERRDIREIIARARDLNSWSNNARNKYLSLLRSLLTVLVDEEIIPFNPAFGIKDDPVESTGGYKNITDEEKERIAEHLMTKAPDYFEYLMMIYEDGIRRKEALMLQVRDVNLLRKEIIIRAEVAKTNTQRVVPVTDTLLQIFTGRELWKLPADHYIFSADKFRPGPRQYHPNTPTDWWRQLVQKELNIDCKMYALKHRGADDKIRANIPLDALRTLFGHRSKQMTEIYARAVTEQYHQQIIDKAPSFAKVVQMKKTG